MGPVRRVGRFVTRPSCRTTHSVAGARWAVPVTPRPPLFTARIDRDRATIRARGRLDSVTADLLRGTVESLQRDGHAAITLDLDEVTAAVPGQDGADVLTAMVEELSAVGTRIVVRRKPSWSTSPASP